MRRSWFLGLALPLLLLCLQARAAPLLVNHEGLVLDEDGLPMEGMVTLRFALYDRAEGGNPLWFEEYQVELVDGYYLLRLGEQSDLAGLFEEDARYLGISVNHGEELRPRHRLVSVPYAMVAENTVGHITPSSVWVGGQQVIDDEGNWVGPPVPGAGDGVGYETPEEVLAALRTVDGEASGLDADMMDGHDGSDYVRGANQVLALLTAVDGRGSGLDADRLDGLDSGQLVTEAGQVLSLLLTLDGSGSGLDADRLDGLDSSKFMRVDRDTGTSGDLAIVGTILAGDILVDSGSRLGIGADPATAELDVEGAIRLRPREQEPADPVPGMIYFDAEASAFRGFDGQQWISFGQGGGGGDDDDQPQGEVDPAALEETILDDAPSGYWPLNERAGTTAYDRSGFGRHGTYHGRLQLGQPGHAGLAADFAAAGYVTTEVQLGELMDDQNGTVTALVKLPANLVDFNVDCPGHIPRHVWSSRSWFQGVSVGTFDDVAGLHFWSFYSGNEDHRVSVEAEAGEWVHLAWVKRDGELLGYVNGEEHSVDAAQAMAGMGVFNIGRRFDDRTFPPTYPGMIQHVAVFPRGLSAERIQAQVDTAELMSCLDGPGGPEGNLAQGKPTVQSSNYSGTSPARAVDGNTSGNWGNNSTTHTNHDRNAWWEVDIQRVSFIRAIETWNRTDCCSERLSNYYVFVSEAPFVSRDLAATRAQAGVLEFHVPGRSGNPTTINVNARGRYVRVQLGGTNYLSLAEVRVLGSQARVTNTALRKPTVQSSNHGGTSPARAVDGNTSGNWAHNSTTHTNHDLHAWWQVDLESVQRILYIETWNRTDCCSERLSNYYVFVSREPFASNDLAATRAQAGVLELHVPGRSGNPTTIEVNASGRYVRVQLGGTNYLSLAEVRVMVCVR